MGIGRTQDNPQTPRDWVLTFCADLSELPAVVVGRKIELPRYSESSDSPGPQERSECRGTETRMSAKCKRSY